MPFEVDAAAFTDSLAAWGAERAAVMQVGIEAAAEVAAEEARRLLNQRSHPRGTPTPSSPGSPPARIDGHLHDSIEVRPAPTAAGPAADLVADIVYSRIQELGGTAGNGAVLPARPFLAPAVEQTHEAMSAAIRAAWD